MQRSYMCKAGPRSDFGIPAVGEPVHDSQHLLDQEPSTARTSSQDNQKKDESQNRT